MFTIINAGIYTSGAVRAQGGQLKENNRGILPNSASFDKDATLSCIRHAGLLEEEGASRFSTQTCAICGAKAVSVYRFTDELQCLEPDEDMIIAERQECPFSNRAWHLEIEILEEAARKAVGIDLERRLWDRIISIIDTHYEEVTSHNKKLETEFGY